MLMHATILVLVMGADQAATPEPAAVDSRDYGPCGPVALYCVSRLLGQQPTLSRIHELVGPADVEKRHSFKALADAATELGLHPVALTTTPEELQSLPLPAIAHMRYSYTQHREHFVTVVNCSDEGVLLLDPPHSPVRVTWESFHDAFTGHLLCLARDAGQKAAIDQQYLSSTETGMARLLVLLDLTLLLGYVAWRVANRSAFTVGSPRAHLPRHVRRILATVACLSAAALGFREAIVGGLVGRPDLHVEDTIELGALAIGGHQHKVQLKNRGSASLVIRGATSTCGCTTAHCPSRIEPGASDDLVLELAVSPGAGHSAVTLDSNDPASPRVIDVYWLGPQQPTIHPASVVAHNAPCGRACEQLVVLRYLGYQGMTFHPSVQLLTTDDDKRRLQVRPVGGPRLRERDTGNTGVQREYEVSLQISIDGPAEPGHVDMLAYLGVQHADENYRLRLPISIDFVAESAATKE